MNGIYAHVPVLEHEVVDLLVTDRAGCYVDGTVGGGGHAVAVLEQLSAAGTLVGIDKDAEALSASKARLSGSAEHVRFIQGDFMSMTQLLAGAGIASVSGILWDLGVSSHQIDTPGRGFSYTQAGPLDMRMDPTIGMTAGEIVNAADETELVRIFREYGEERLSRPIARAIIRARSEAILESTADLVGVVRSVVKGGPLYKSCARIFQALRISVNDELKPLSRAIESAVDLLNAAGRLVIITYHSLEDRIVKHTFRNLAADCVCPPGIPQCICGHVAKVRIVTRKPVYPSPEEVEANPRSRSARARCVERLETVASDEN